VTGHTYKVSFQPLVPPVTTSVGGHTVTVNDSWSLTDSTLNQVLLSGQLNRFGDTDYRVVDGIQVVETGKYSPAIASAAYSGTHKSEISGVNWGLPFFGGGAGSGNDFQGSSLDPGANPDSFVTVELRFGVKQKCYRFLRLQLPDGSAPDPGRGYAYGGYHDCNFQVWDVTHNRQLDAFFVERMYTAQDGTYLPLAQQPACQDSTWDPGIDPNGTASDGDREYLYIVNTPYSATPKAQWTVDATPNGGAAPVLYFLGAWMTNPADIFTAGNKFTWTWANPATSNDVFVFDTSKLKQNNAALAKNKLAAIRAVPNPYYSHSTYELSQFGRIVRFINLPEACKIRIFNLAGQLVRTLDKTNASSSTLDWDLLTTNQLPVGSGVYIYYVDAPGVGSQVGRVAIFMEKERLNNF
jgi:hypothetical protein